MQQLYVGESNFEVCCRATFIYLLVKSHRSDKEHSSTFSYVLCLAQLHICWIRLVARFQNWYEIIFNSAHVIFGLMCIEIKICLVKWLSVSTPFDPTFRRRPLTSVSPLLANVPWKYEYVGFGLHVLRCPLVILKTNEGSSCGVWAFEGSECGT